MNFLTSKSQGQGLNLLGAISKTEEKKTINPKPTQPINIQTHDSRKDNPLLNAIIESANVHGYRAQDKLNPNNDSIWANQDISTG